MPDNKKISANITGTAVILITALLLGLFTLFNAHANAASLGEAQLRSWLGEPLEIQIPITTNVTVEEIVNRNCLSVTAESQPAALSRDLRVSMIETSAKPVFVLRGSAAFNEPFLQIVVRYACANQNGQNLPQTQGAISRQYTLLVDPRPNIETPVLSNLIPTTPTSSPRATSASLERQRLRDQWITSANDNNQARDSLADIAEGVFPKSIKRKARYIAALRALNPALDGLDDNAPLPPNMALTLPNLRVLGSTRAVVAAQPDRISQAQSPSATPAAITAATSRGKPRQTTTVNERRNTGTAPPAPVASTRPSNTSFTLKLSGAGIDTSRSDNITETERAVLRERQFLLDADDQIAQFLSLKNSVKQLESRLNQVQARLDAEAINNNANPSLNPSSQTAAQPTATQPAPQTIPTAPQPAATPNWLSQMLTGNIAVASAFFITLVVISILMGRLLKHRRAKKSTEADNAIETEIAQLSAIEDAKKVALNPANDGTGRASVANISPHIAAQHAADDLALAARRQKSASDVIAPASTSASQVRQAFDATATIKLEAPGGEISNADNSNSDLFDDDDDGHSIQFDLDNSPSTTVDFLLDDTVEVSESAATSATNNNAVDKMVVDKALRTNEAQETTEATTEARLRRLQYMNERFPELMFNTTSINDADSVINTARHYLVETQNGAAKATELLGYALEERPQEIRFWLAQFETFRVKLQTTEYIDLAQKFSILFGQSVEWRHVRQIGYDLAPKNSLFSLPAGTPTGAKFDSSTWLIVDPEKTKLADSRAIALRTALINEHNAREATKLPESAKSMKGTET